ncbi:MULTISPECIES: hypothetical protein [Romboutsia]|uniref:Uncharacterized protein n=1 Tax=Romboutsia hominis TaxID=1507512 RepID=A0A2P2BSR1_9FIRM|nr:MULTISPECIES: hypothetical protein [Romboutsia]MCH1960647.1 hypothetical protein [Romboutsia hominis]MCH1968921.1 hypothetical protein [Romboutsia hominis]MDB8793559.1 hypothetical protein [Romboutsia sp. 1001216sp1]MDB8794956.1 hypothetical protein [Romboutsia sp. 1001216sp1]MDB8798767.1 hypothetical protein [Romboutsia sp. 1001216sp1]
MEKYYNLLGLHLNDVLDTFKDKNIKYTIEEIKGKKDQEALIVPKVIKISETSEGVKILVTYFSDSLK